MEITLSHILLLVILILAILALVLAFMGARIKQKWDATSMYNVAVCLVIASILAGTISFLAVWVALPNSKEIDFTHQDVVVDIFGVLVTVLIGWNIFTVVDIKKKADEVDRISNDFAHVVTGVMRLNMKGFLMRGDKDALIHSCFTSLEEILNCDNRNFSKSAVNEIMTLLHNIHQSYSGSMVYIYPDMQQKYLFVLSNDYIQSQYKEEIVNMIKGAKDSSNIGEEVQFASGSNKSEATGSNIL